MHERYLGIDLGAETIKFILLERQNGQLVITYDSIITHDKNPIHAFKKGISTLDWESLTSVVTTGRISRVLNVERVPAKAALAKGVSHKYPEIKPVTVVSIGSHGFSVLELRTGNQQIFRENSRCSQGTGNFLRQLVGRFDLDIETASKMACEVNEPASLSGRCPVILKTDMTHLANKGEDRRAILAGLYDAVCENVQVLINPNLSPPRVLLSGGVCRSRRVRDNFRHFLTSKRMTLVESNPRDGLFLEALGAALIAADQKPKPPSLEMVISPRDHSSFEITAPLTGTLNRVKRMQMPKIIHTAENCKTILGYDIGSTGSKAVAIEIKTKRILWEGYVSTSGDPVCAARKLTDMFLREANQRLEVYAVGVTGSGREIVGSLLASCFDTDVIFVLNEIASHAEGALYFDPMVDTIFEIGGQDAKYIRLDNGRICDAAMNEACSAGTGSFIEEQGKKFQNINTVKEMGKMAMEADHCLSLGQHCSVFMAEIIDEAVASGCDQGPILAGIYDSIIQNYLNRVKGNRSVGKRIFCQGMPFMSDALAAAVGRQTGQQVIIPPNPGTIGALGISLLTHKEITITNKALELEKFLNATVDRRDQFICKSNKGCGGSGNKCRIDRIYTTVNGNNHTFLWGGNCSLYDKGTSSIKKLPDLTPDPFSERREMIQAIIEKAHKTTTAMSQTIAICEEFTLKGLLPFYATFFKSLGLVPRIYSGAGYKELKKGIEAANIPFCAPMQLYYGVISKLIADNPDYIFAPRLRELPRQKEEVISNTCPIVQGSPDIIQRLGTGKPSSRFITTRIDMGKESLYSKRFRNICQLLAQEVGGQKRYTYAYTQACKAQSDFDQRLKEIGQRALNFAATNNIVPVVVLGRAYTIHNDVLNSNVPSLLRSQGAIAIPVDCYPITNDVPVFTDMYWGYSQLNLRAAHQIRRTDNVYAIYCSNYSCGPDSFNLHFFSYIMENKPFSIIETDGHTGDAGTKTRIEAFLYCIESYRRLEDTKRAALKSADFKALENNKINIKEAHQSKEVILLPSMGAITDILASLLQSEGIYAETLPKPTNDSLRLGRQYTSGKECIPMIITAGSLLERLNRESDSDKRFAFFIPTSHGPCRFGVYNILHKIILEKTNWGNRVRIVAPNDQDYFAGMSPDFRVRAIAGYAASDLLMAALHDVRPCERERGISQQIYDNYFNALIELLSSSTASSLLSALGELPNGMFGISDLMSRAANDFRLAKDFSKRVPTVSMVGEIYVRLEPYANNFIIKKLEERGLRVIVSPFTEWLEYTTSCEIQRIKEDRNLDGDHILKARFSSEVEIGVINRVYNIFATRLDWGSRTSVADVIKASSPFINSELQGEAILTLGGPIHEDEHGVIDGVISVGPHECMPNKIAEAQFFHVGEEKDIISLTLSMNGDPVDPEILDRFAFEVKERFAEKQQKKGKKRLPAPRNIGAFARQFQRKVLFNSLSCLSLFNSRS
ncbi:MAG: acyl-CoA dehydratase activase-related protein [Candidatus Scalindua sp.]|nr:acyl-CoA dehydratase activase-related protein [Candidatus Scalindua sp.]